MRVAQLKMVHQPGDIRKRGALAGAGTTGNVIDVGVAHLQLVNKAAQRLQRLRAAACQRFRQMNGGVAGVVDEHPLHQRFHGCRAPPLQAKSRIALQDVGGDAVHLNRRLKGYFFRQQTFCQADGQHQLAQVRGGKGAVTLLRQPGFAGGKIHQQPGGLPFCQGWRRGKSALQQADNPPEVGIANAPFDQHDIAVAQCRRSGLHQRLCGAEMAAANLFRQGVVQGTHLVTVQKCLLAAGRQQGLRK